MTVSELKTSFVYAFNQEPTNIYFAPGQVNLIGEYTDLCIDTLPLPALSFGIYLLIRRNNENCIRFWSLNEPEAIHIDINKLSDQLNKTWIQYPVSVFDYFIKSGVEITDGFDILIWGNIPERAKMSSVNILKIITAYALDDQLNVCLIENIVSDMNLGNKNRFNILNPNIINDFSFKADSVSVLFEGIKIIISNTHSPHDLYMSPYKKLSAECEVFIDKYRSVYPLKNSSELNELEFKSIETIIDNPIILKRAIHFRNEVQYSKRAIKALAENRLDLLHQIVNDLHISLCENFEIVSPEVDFMVTEAYKVEGFVCSRMIGSGLGACTISLIKNEHVFEFVKIIGEAYKSKTGMKPQFYIAEIGSFASKLICN